MPLNLKNFIVVDGIFGWVFFPPFKFEYIALFYLYINYLTILSKYAKFKFYFNRNNFQIFVLQKWYIYIMLTYSDIILNNGSFNISYHNK